MRQIFLMMGLFFLSFGVWADTTNVAAPVATQAIPAAITVPVVDQSQTALQQGVQTAFSQLVSQISSNPNAMTLPAIKDAQQHIMQWVQSYQYVTQPGNAGGLSLQVTFDNAGLEKLLQPKAKAVAAQKAPVIQASSSDTQLVINHVSSMMDYRNMMEALRQIQGVESVTTLEISGDAVTVNVKTADNTTDFQQTLSGSNHFKSSDSSFQPAGITPLSHYIWVG